MFYDIKVMFKRFNFMKDYWTPYMQFPHSLAPKHCLELLNVSKVVPCLGELNVCIIFGNWGF
jgi:hypothetical protein